MKRLSQSIRQRRNKNRDSVASVNGTNGTNGVNGTGAAVNGDSSSAPAPKKQSTSTPTTNGFAQPTDPKTGGNKQGVQKSSSEARGNYPEPTEHNATPAEQRQAVHSLMDMVAHSMRSPTEREADYVEHDARPGIFKDLGTIGIRDMKTLKEQIQAGSGPIDDKTMLMERIIQLVADLPDRSKTRDNLTYTFIDQLYNSLQHPPLSYLGDDYKYRKADGSMNNFQVPHLGSAGQPYARTVQPESVQPGALPDPGLLFDAVMARETFRPHPNKNSSIIFYWASLVIHDCFQTDHHDFAKSNTSSYLDLSPLYGDTQEDQDTIRTFKDGKLKPDCFAEHRLLTFPPGCGVLLIMFNRFHNHVAENLAIVNEGGKFTKPSEKLTGDAATKAWKKYDNDLFQTARLVTGGLYMNITLVDYVRTIINLNRSNTTWTLDPRVKTSDTNFNDGGHAPRGEGNQVSAEFSMVYRWHSAISEKDEAFSENLFKHMFGKPAGDVSMPELLAGLSKMEAEMPEDPLHRPFAGLKRDENGNFNTDELVEIITSSIEDVAGAFGANHIPKCLKAIDMLGMKQARAWEMCSLNEFRKFFGLQTHKTFEDINHHPEVAEQLRNLYESVDNVELYTGLVAEDAKDPMPPSNGGPVGVGISPTYTISRAILSDAVALVRGDRFYTIDYTPRNLTNWGYAEVDKDYSVEQGCCFSKLFVRVFPDHFKPNSIYAHQPMTVPEENRKIMQSLGRESHYSWDRPTRMAKHVTIQNYRGVREILDNPKIFKSVWSDACQYVMGGDLVLTQASGFDGKPLNEAKWLIDIKNFFESATIDLLKRHSNNVAGRQQIDITRDVGNLANVLFAANVFSLPLKSEAAPKGIYTEHELYLIMAVLSLFISDDIDPVQNFPLSLKTSDVTQGLGKQLEANVKSLQGASGWLSSLTDKAHHSTGPLAEYGSQIVKKLLDGGMDQKQVVWGQIIPTTGQMVANQARAITQILEFYLVGPGKEHWSAIHQLALSNAADADDKLLKYAMEGLRLHGTFGSYRNATAATTVNDAGFGGPETAIKQGDKVWVSFIKANFDPQIFPDPESVKLDRPMDTYLYYGAGPHQCLGQDATRAGLTAMFRTIAKLENLRPAPGPQGQLKKVPKEDGFYDYMDAEHSTYFPFPTTWKLHYDGKVPELKA